MAILGRVIRRMMPLARTVAAGIRAPAGAIRKAGRPPSQGMRPASGILARILLAESVLP